VDSFLDRPQARIAYRVEAAPPEAAPGTPVLVTHSFLGSRELEDRIGVFDWSPVRSGGKPLIRFDARGHGASSGDSDAERYRWPALAEDLLAVVDAAVPDASAIDVIAESTGCGTLLWAASLAPERFRRLVLVIPPTIREVRAEQAEIYLASAQLIELRGAEAWARMIETFPPVPLLSAGGWERARKVPVDIALLPSVLRGAAASDLPADDVLAGIRQETLILAWETDPSHPVTAAEHLARLLPNATLEVATEPESVRDWGERVAAFLAAPEPGQGSGPNVPATSAAGTTEAASGS
jgi:pimeloyl-ACP methyl ester carboxylesterase